MKKILIWLFAGTTSLLMSACYGAVNAYNKTVGVNAKDGSGNPIPGLEVSLFCESDVPLQTGTTSSWGDLYLSLSEDQDLDSCNLEINDIDGEENGGKFSSKSIPLNNSQIDYDVVMELE